MWPCRATALLANNTITSNPDRSEEHTSELQSQSNLVCRLLLEKKKDEDVGVLAVRHCLSERKLALRRTVKLCLVLCVLGRNPIVLSLVEPSTSHRLLFTTSAFY